jgi:hypothetical protein
VTVSQICRMVDDGCFADGMGHEPREETMSEPQDDEAMVFEEFFTAGLRMPPHPMLADILLKYQIYVHQLTLNTIVQLSKYVWAVTSFGGVPSAKGFTKRYKLHYQPRKVDIDGVDMLGQYGCINFDAKRGGQWARLTVAVKNKWVGSWLQGWFYCKVPWIQSPSPGCGKGVYALHYWMAELSFISDPLFDYPDGNASNATFVKATHTRWPRCHGRIHGLWAFSVVSKF